MIGFIFAFVLAQVPADRHSLILGNIRIEPLSPTLVRVEEKGSEGFEDRATFNVVERTNWPGCACRVTTAGDLTTVQAKGWTLAVREGGANLGDVTAFDAAGKQVYRYDGQLRNAAWLPDPGSKPDFWRIADAPRIVPSPVGAAPFGQDSTSGWDLGNDAPDVYLFFPGHDSKRLRADVLKLTGPIELPPLYALGFTDSRYYAYHQQEALDRIAEYRRRRIPLDTFVVDTDWRIGGSAGYTPDSQFFPDMPAFLAGAHRQHAHVMFNDHPEPKTANALDPAELGFRYQGMAGLLHEGLDVWWFDRNWGVSLKSPSPKLRHEVFGMKLYHDMTQMAEPDRRPLIMANVDGIDNGILDRPPEVAAHRYPVQWTGDTSAKWEYLRHGVENAVHEGALGLNAWVNEDLGGHIGKPSPDLYIRYLEYGSVCPFMRVHCTKGQTREPWAFGADAARIVPDYIAMRYRLMPYLYAFAREAYDDGTPLLRRLDLAFPSYPEASREDQFLLGDSILVAPILDGHEAAAIRSSAFPDGVSAEYFANNNLKGEPVAVGRVPNIDFDWGDNGSPNAAVPHDNFSARWTGRLAVPQDGDYRLSITSDDGCRVWIDGKLVIDKWEPQDSVTTEAPEPLPAGTTHTLRIEYMQLSGGALCKLRWARVARREVPAERPVWLPPGTWTNVWTGERVHGPRVLAARATLGQMPMYLRDGAIVPLGPEVQWTGERDWSDLGLLVVPGAGRFSLYEDDGTSPAYQIGAFRRTPITVAERGRTLHVSIGRPIGTGYPGMPKSRSWTIRVLVPVAKSVTVDGLRSAVRFIGPVERMPFEDAGGEPAGRILEVRVPASSRWQHEIVVRE